MDTQLKWDLAHKQDGVLIQTLMTQAHRWVARRVETVGFIDEGSVTRRITIDVDWDEVVALLPDGYGAPEIPLPLTLLDKGLLVDFDLRDMAGNAVPLATRRFDSYLAWTWVMHVAEDQGIKLDELAEVVVRQVFEIAHSFPGGSSADVREPPEWQPHEKEDWARLVAVGPVRELLDVLQRQWLPIYQAPRRTGTTLIKFGYREQLQARADAGFALLPTPLTVHVPSLGLSDSYHLRVDVPPGMGLVGSRLIETPKGTEPTARQLRARRHTEPLSHRRLPTSAQACFYFSNVPVPKEPREIWASIAARLPIGGFVRAVWAASWIAVALTVLTALYRDTLSAPANRGGATAFLVTVPLAVEGYLIRPGPHPIHEVVRRRLRYLGVVCFLATFVASTVVVLATRPSAIVLWTAAGAAVIVWLLVSAIVLATGRDHKRAGEGFGKTVRIERGDVLED